MGRQPIAIGFLTSCALISPGIATQSSDGWQLQSQHAQSPVSLTLSLRALHEVKGWLSLAQPVLTIQCSGGRAEVYVEAGLALEVTQVDQQVVRVRFDDSEFHSERWREVGNWTISSRHPDRFIGQLLRSRSLLLEFTPFSSAPVQADFAVQGLAQYSEQLAIACGAQAGAKGGSGRDAQ